MSQALRQVAKKLIRLARLNLTQLKQALKSTTRNIIKALSEIAFNIKAGVAKVTNKIKNSRIIKALADKDIHLTVKRKILKSPAAGVIVLAILKAVLNHLLCLHGSPHGFSS